MARSAQNVTNPEEQYTPQKLGKSAGIGRTSPIVLCGDNPDKDGQGHHEGDKLDV